MCHHAEIIWIDVYYVRWNDEKDAGGEVEIKKYREICKKSRFTISLKKFRVINSTNKGIDFEFERWSIKTGSC